MSEKKTHIIKDIGSHVGVGESAKIYMIVEISSGKSQVVVEKTLSKRMSITKYEEAERLYERLTGGNGRRAYTLDDLVEEKI